MALVEILVTAKVNPQAPFATGVTVWLVELHWTLIKNERWGRSAATWEPIASWSEAGLICKRRALTWPS